MKYLIFIVSYEIYGAVLVNALKLHGHFFRKAVLQRALKHRFSASPECTLKPFRCSKIIEVLFGFKVRKYGTAVLFAVIYLSALIPAEHFFSSSVSLIVAAVCAFVPAGSLVSKFLILCRGKSSSRSLSPFSR